MEALIIAKLIVLLNMWVSLLTGTTTDAVGIAPEISATSTQIETMEIFDYPSDGVVNAPLIEVPVEEMIPEVIQPTNPNIVDKCKVPFRGSNGVMTYKTVCVNK